MVILISLLRPVEMVTAETKIFSVAVQAGKTEGSASRNPPLRDVEGQMVDRPVILSTRARERHCSDDEFKPAQREALEQPEVEAVPEETFVIEEKVQEEQPVVAETKKQKKSKKKGKNPEPMTCSSADEIKEVEVKPKKKKNKKEKTPEPELIVHRPDETKTKPVVEDIVTPKEKTETEEIFEEFVSKDEISYPDDFSPDKDLVEFSESEDKVIEIDEDQDDSEKVDFFIREKSSSVESDDLRVASSTIDETAAKPNPWFNKFLQKSSSLIEDQIFGAAKKYEAEEKMDEDDDMLELEMNQTNVETNIAALLEDDEVVTEEPKSERTSSSLPMILQLDPKQSSSSKTPADVYSSDDDLQFKPVPSKRNKKKGKQQQQKFNDDFDTQEDSCPADSESEKFSEFEDTQSSKSKGKDGWSFEIDEEDVNKMLEGDTVNEVTVDTEERTALEDVFRYLQAKTAQI